MVYSRVRYLHLMMLALSLIPFAHAYDFPPISEEDKQFKEVPGIPGAPAAVLYREEEDDDVKNHYHMTYVRMKILTEAGRKYADVIAEFQKGFSTIENVSGRTIHADGTIIPFDGKVYDKEILKSKGFKIHAKSFTLPDVQVGSIIEFRYFFRYQDHWFVAPQWIVQNDLWQKKVHFKFLPMDTYNYTLLNSREQAITGVSWTSFCPKDAQPKLIQQPTGQAVVELNGSNIAPFVDEPYMVSSPKFKFNVHFYYTTKNKQEDFWKQEGKFWSRDAEKFMSKKDGVAEQVAQLVSASDTPEQKVQKIYAFVSSMENQSFLQRRSEQEQKTLGLKDSSVSDILKQKSGNRDELTRLFVSMIRAAGIPAYLMTVTSRENNYFEPSYLSADQFDWEIAIVTVDGKEVFLDPGCKFCPYGLLDWQSTATSGLRETADGTAIAETPAPTYMQAITQRVARFVMSANGTLEGTMKVGYIGQDSITHRQAALRTDDEGRKKDLEEEVKGWLPAGAEVSLVQEPVWNATTKDFVAAFHIKAAIGNNAGKRMLAPLHVFQLNQGPMFPSAERVNGIYFYYPSREIDDITVTVPASLEVENLPQPENVKLDYAMYKSEWSRQQNNINVKRDLAMAAFVFPQTDYKQLKGFYDQVKAGDDQQAILKVSANAVGQ